MDAKEAAATECREPGAGGTIPANADEAAKTPAEAVPAATAEPDSKTADRTGANNKSAKEKCRKKHAKSKSKSKKSKKIVIDDNDTSDFPSDDEASSTASSASEDAATDSESEVETKKKRRTPKKRQESAKDKKSKSKSKKTKKQIKTQPPVSDSESNTSDSGSESDEGIDSDQQTQQNQQELQLRLQMQQMQIQQLQQQQQQQQQQQRVNAFGYGAAGGGLGTAFGTTYDTTQYIAPPLSTSNNGVPPRRNPQSGRSLLDGLKADSKRQGQKTKSKPKALACMDFKRVDQVWDSTIHNYKLQDTAETTTDAHYEEYLFHVRRTFDWEGKYKFTTVDIKSKLLREALQEVIGNIKGVSLVEETPKVDPNLLFLYLEDFRQYLKRLKKEKPSGSDKHERKKDQKRIENKRLHLKILIKYLDKDYAQVKKSLYPMLENGLITFDLIWALWKPNTLAYTSTYGSHDEPRVFKVEMAEKHYTIVKGDYYYIEGKYFEFDGKQFGFGSMSEEIQDFQGAKKITSLDVYPLKYHKNESKLRRDLVERGKKFVGLSGVHYKSHHGMAYYKKKKAVVKVNVNGRIMVDPSIHRRINPNYTISPVRPKDHDIISDGEDSEFDSCCGCVTDSDGGDTCGMDSDEKTKYVTKLYQDEKGNIRSVRVAKADLEDGVKREKLDSVKSKTKEAAAEAAKDGDQPETKEKPAMEFTDEEYLIASPVVLGFAFSEKMWLEFTVSGVKEIQWNEKAYDSLVLEPKTKDIVKALVESHKYHPAESIDDVIQGKGKGLVAVLHGPPGTGKTLTAEGISELLKCPLYMVSAGELGTDSRFLEGELQKILDICHAWGAILLLDEADVFLEKRNMHDIHRNALVSIFLRQLEYFQGILFLTTNRVETFDDAFQSRIHIALRYDELDHKARKAIFKIFVERVRVLEKVSTTPFTEEEYTDLAKHDLNGRQIKNTVRTAQALAVNKGEPLSMKHIKQVLDVLTSFDRDLKGGTGYQDAMRSYF